MTIFDLAPFLYPAAVVIAALAIIGAVNVVIMIYRAVRWIRMIRGTPALPPRWGIGGGLHL